jgi:hypothetical protein
MRSPARQSSTMRPRVRRPWGVSPAQRITAMISSTVGVGRRGIQGPYYAAGDRDESRAWSPPRSVRTPPFMSASPGCWRMLSTDPRARAAARKPHLGTLRSSRSGHLRATSHFRIRPQASARQSAHGATGGVRESSPAGMTGVGVTQHPRVVGVAGAYSTSPTSSNAVAVRM